MQKVIKIILLMVCIAIFIFSAYKIYNYIREANANRKLNSKLIEKSVTLIHNSILNEENESTDIMPISVDFTVLKQECKDIVGWIYSEGTPINYPVVQSYDNQYYLRRLLDGSYNTAGTIFMDFRNNSELTDNNTIIYGHNMKNDKMFGTFQEYKNQEYYNNHKLMYYLTPEKNYKIELVAGCSVSVNSDIYNLSEEQNKDQELMQKSDFKSDVIVTDEDKIIILSTCSYEYDGARYILMGVLREIVE